MAAHISMINMPVATQPRQGFTCSLDTGLIASGPHDTEESSLFRQIVTLSTDTSVTCQVFFPLQDVVSGHCAKRGCATIGYIDALRHKNIQEAPIDTDSHPRPRLMGRFSGKLTWEVSDLGCKRLRTEERRQVCTFFR